MSADSEKSGAEGAVETNKTDGAAGAAAGGMGPKQYLAYAAQRVAEGKPIVEGAEAMAARMQTLEPAVMTVPLHELFVRDEQMRAKVNEADIDDLVESIRLNGFTSAIPVRRVGDRLEVVAGHRRYRAALKLQLREVPVIIQVQGDELSRLSTQATENTTRKDVNAIEWANHALRMLEAAAGDHDQAARHMNIERPRFSELLAIARLPDQVKAEIARRGLPAAQATLFGRLHELYRSSLPNNGKGAVARTLAAMTRSSKVGWTQKRLQAFLASERERLSGMKKARRAAAKPSDGADGQASGEGLSDGVGDQVEPADAAEAAEATAGSAMLPEGLFAEVDGYLIINKKYLADGKASGAERADLAKELQAIYNAMRPK